MITRQTIDAVFSAARVEEVIGDFVNLKRAGGNLKGLSPFVDEKSPSFMVSPAKQIWKDFSSGKGGNVVTFLMEHEQFTYPEALRWLAKKYNIEIEEDREQTDEQKEGLKLRESLYLVSEFAKKYFSEELNESEEGKNIGLSYFKERGFTKETIDKFELGYSPSKRNAFTEHAEKKGYSKALLEASGLSIYNEQGNGIDRFRERVMFPIHSFSGRILGFGGRILRSDVKAAKYLNSPESEIYHKSKILYGIFQSKQAILKQNECLLVEGYTDVISLHQSGIENVVASSGTALTPDQIRLIKRLTPNVTILYDGDSAGIKASFRGIDLMLEEGMNIKAVTLPDGLDPDMLAKKYSEEEIRTFLISNRKDFLTYKLEILKEDSEKDDSELIDSIVENISRIPNIVNRDKYISQMSESLSVDAKMLQYKLERILISRQLEESNDVPKPKVFQVVKNEGLLIVDPITVVEEEIIRLIMQFGNLVVELKSDDDEPYETTVIEEIVRQFQENDFQLKNELYQSILEDVKLGYEQEELRAGDFFVKLFDETKTSVASEAMIEKYSVSKNWSEKKGIFIKPKEENIVKDVTDTILRYKSFYIDDKIKEFSQMLKDVEVTGEFRIEQIEKIMILTQMRSKIFAALNRVI